MMHEADFTYFTPNTAFHSIMKTLSRLHAVFILICITFEHNALAQSLELEYDAGRSRAQVGVADAAGTFGGVSGMEYVPQTNKWYFITDGDAPGRQSYLFEMTGSGADQLPQWTAADQAKRTALNGVTQAEAIRFDGKQFWICTEEEAGPEVKADSIFEKGYIGKLSEARSSVEKPLFEYTSALNNRGYEALALAGKDTVCAISEWPFVHDGRYARLTLMTCPDGGCKTIAEYAYELDINSCVREGSVVDGSVGNGISEMLYIGNGRFLMLERCFDRKSASAKLYETRITRQATNIHGQEFQYLGQSGPFRPLPKQEVFNFSLVKGLKTDNVEAMTWGPGRKTLLVMSDDNYKSPVKQKTQWIVLKVIGGL